MSNNRLEQVSVIACTTLYQFISAMSTDMHTLIPYMHCFVPLTQPREPP
jgi:hypothetical protein